MLSYRVHWVSSDNNVADLLTRGEAKLQDIGPGSRWMHGPNFLLLQREYWPIHRDFIRQSLPKEEIKTLRSLLRVAAVQFSKGVNGAPEMPRVFQIIHKILEYSHSLESRIRVVARIINGWRSFKLDGSCNIELSVRKPPTPEDLARAEELILVIGMLNTVVAYEEGRLSGLMPVRKGRLIVTTGRLGESCLQSILGVAALPILMSDCRVAELYMYQAHMGYSGLFHRSTVANCCKE